MARTLTSIKDELKLYQMSRHPKLRDYSPLSVLSILNESVARQILKMEELIDERAKKLSVLTATGADLDALVKDRLPGGRLPGEKASGSIKFERYLPAVSEIEIPKGCRVRVPREDLVFETLETGYIREGETSVTIPAVAEDYGSRYNVGAYTITQMVTHVWGVDRVYNELPFEGGKDQESDDELRQRYITSIMIPGKATRPILEQRLLELVGVYEARVFPADAGEIEVVADTPYIRPALASISDTLRQNMAAGVVSRGKLAAKVGAQNRPGIATTGGGKVYVRAKNFVQNAESITLTYLDTYGNQKIASVSVPAKTPRGACLRCYMENPDDLATKISAISYSGSSEYDVLIGLGEYPYLWIPPRRVQVLVQILIRKDMTASADLEDDIVESVRTYLDNRSIGESLEYSDLLRYIYTDFGTGTSFRGIDEIVGCTVVGKDRVLTSLGDRLEVEHDERIEPGTVSVQSE
ncbi:MAG: baseplate J/gp47 family protein [Methanothrix sp.]|nr:baseplate J/gp47 family protein [Methanothrix sp.]MCX8207521.1 baseplate J/gp47 family protein [Methanothrix sp.]